LRRRNRDIYIPARFALKNSSLKRTLTVKRLYVFTAAKAAWNFRYRHKEKSTSRYFVFCRFQKLFIVFAATQVGDTYKCAVLLPKINLTAHLRKRRKTDILRRINIGSEAFKLLLSVFFSRHEAMACRP